MTQEFEKRLSAVGAAGGDLLYGGLKGIEKESLRVTADGDLSTLSHPSSLGSALTNRFITTDFSEALLEFVTPAYETTWEALHCICDIHQFTYSSLGDDCPAMALAPAAPRKLARSWVCASNRLAPQARASPSNSASVSLIRSCW